MTVTGSVVLKDFSTISCDVQNLHINLIDQEEAKWSISDQDLKDKMSCQYNGKSYNTPYNCNTINLQTVNTGNNAN